MGAQIRMLAYPAHLIARRLLAATGLSQPFRRVFGPLAGRILSRMAAGNGGPSMVRGHRMHLAPKGGFPPLAMALDRYEEATTQLFESLIAPGAIVIDAGAHVGYYSLLAARHVGSEGKVYSFEPDPANYNLLLENIELNGYSNIAPVNAAVSNQEGHLSLYLTSLDTGRHSLYHQDLPMKGIVDVPVTTLDNFLAAERWPNIDVVKADVEGSESDLLDGMTELLVKSPNIKLILEFNPSLLLTADVDLDQFLARFTEWGFEVQQIDEKSGAITLDPASRARMVSDLVTDDGSINLFCFRN